MTSQNNENRYEAEIIGHSHEIKHAIATAKKIAKSSSITTLIIGESGTGKELIARMIHDLNSGPHQPFVDINCGAIPETLLESELFGYEKGAFTGAQTRKKGLFELANGGTIFLDEIGNTSTNFQVKLLKAVEYKRFRRINGVEEISVSTRIIAATNIDLQDAIHAGKFREDLYYRLNVCQIRVPPLRERGKDVLILSQYFIDRFNQEYDRQVEGLTPSAVKFVQKYPWPGNIRQLKNAIERAVLVEADRWIEAEHLSPQSRTYTPAALRDTGDDGQEITEVDTTKLPRFEIPPEGVALEDFEKEIILNALEKTNGNISQAARLLRINRGKLRYRMERLGVTPGKVHEFKAKAFV